MARFRTNTISRRTVEALKVEKDTVFWDREPPGSGCMMVLHCFNLLFVCCHFHRKRNASEFNQTPALAGASLT